MSEQDSHISTGAKAEQPPGPTRQHHRMATGDKVSGTTKPNGDAGPSTQNKVGNAPCTY